ncbi:hypothetical protein [Goodfellowiella coeruleoviolacea]|uniref:Uncharacterized protein n=1 Tax=Goodfellowiella coeruleoviolacea TaxID=334858 RepID=A0AAE3G9V2_9PSEU|nr:hypothetical protein [Goodfellowiella coeruleoviolacea]MCP2163923.1 hypothetical protein [Goodfellowiella coeruleoviolacea]
MSNIPYVKSETMEIVPEQQAAAEFAGLTKDFPQLTHLRAAVPVLLGTSIEAAESRPFGLRSQSTLSSAVPVGSSEVENVNSAFIVQSLTNGSTQLALCATIIKGQPAGETLGEVFALRTTTGGQLDQVEEFTPEPTAEGKVVLRDGWWNRLTTCLSRENCGTTCLNAALTCPKVNWAVFLGCLAGRCGGCIVKCAACATCDCSFWCKFVAGCCNG